MTWYGLKVLGFLVVLLFVPLIGSCMWACFKDPVTPHLILEIWLRTKELLCGRTQKSKRKRTSDGRSEERRRRRQVLDPAALERERAAWAQSFEQPGFTSFPHSGFNNASNTATGVSGYSDGGVLRAGAGGPIDGNY